MRNRTIAVGGEKGEMREGKVEISRPGYLARAVMKAT